MDYTVMHLSTRRGIGLSVHLTGDPQLIRGAMMVAGRLVARGASSNEVGEVAADQVARAEALCQVLTDRLTVTPDAELVPVLLNVDAQTVIVMQHLATTGATHPIWTRHGIRIPESEKPVALDLTDTIAAAHHEITAALDRRTETETDEDP